MTQLPLDLNSICVFCGSRPGDDPIFLETSQKVGTAIAKAGKRLVFGAGGLGLMGGTAEAALAAGGQVTGIVPDFLKRREIPVPEIQELLIVDSMHTRKRLMYDRSDVFVVLPGGLGTLDELVEIVTWFQLELHNKPVYLVDVNGYWDDWFKMLQKMAKHGFVDEHAVDYFKRVASAEELAEVLNLGPVT
ncbi:MAG: TIGR00730 family Rossman fold protein [Pseudomonadota bacterium]